MAKNMPPGPVFAFEKLLEPGDTLTLDPVYFERKTETEEKPMTKTKQTAEYWLSAHDENDDVIDNEYFNSIRDAVKAESAFKDKFFNAKRISYWKVVRTYHDDGQLHSEIMTEIE